MNKKLTLTIIAMFFAVTQAFALSNVPGIGNTDSKVAELVDKADRFEYMDREFDSTLPLYNSVETGDLKIENKGEIEHRIPGADPRS